MSRSVSFRQFLHLYCLNVCGENMEEHFELVELRSALDLTQLLLVSVEHFLCDFFSDNRINTFVHDLDLNQAYYCRDITFSAMKPNLTTPLSCMIILSLCMDWPALAIKRGGQWSLIQTDSITICRESSCDFSNSALIFPLFTVINIIFGKCKKKKKGHVWQVSLSATGKHLNQSLCTALIVFPSIVTSLVMTVVQ